MPVTSPHANIKPFNSHGVYPEEEQGTDQATCDCPFCGADSKFYVNIETGLYDCKVCGEKGNPIKFIRKVYEDSVESTTEEEYKELAKERGYLKLSTPKRWGLAKSNINDTWLYPGYSGNHHLDKLKNVYLWKEYKNKKRLFSTSSFKQCLFNVQNFDNDKKTIYLTEGCWDGMALWEMLNHSAWDNNGNLEYTGNPTNNLLSDANVLSIPSVNIFEESWAEFFSGKRVIIIPHNDHPKTNKLTGKKGNPLGLQMIKRVVGVLMQLDKPPTEVNYLCWDDVTGVYDPSLKDGYDIRDMLRQGKNHEERAVILTRILSMIKPVNPDWIGESSEQYKAGKLTLDTIECKSYQELTSAWKKALVWHDGIDKTLSVMLAAITSTLMEEDQLWVRVIAPPSSGKTVLCDALCVNRKYVCAQSHIRGFYSGMRPKDEDGKPSKSDYGLIAEIMDKAFITKDGDTLLRSVNHDQIMAEARDLYDGNTKTHFKNDMGKEYKDIRTVWILCGTESLRSLDTSELGERFVTVILLEDVSEELELNMSKKALDSFFSNIRFKKDSRATKKSDEQDMSEVQENNDKKVVLSTNEMDVAKRMTGGYISFLRSPEIERNLIEIGRRGTDKQKKMINELAYFVSFMRSRPSKKQEERATKELSSRLSKQYGKLAVCLAAVMNKKEIDNEVMNIVRSVALDTAAGTVLDVSKMLYDAKLSGKIGLSKYHLQHKLRQREERMTDIMRYLHRIKVVKTIEQRENNNMPKQYYALTDTLLTIFRKIFPPKT